MSSQRINVAMVADWQYVVPLETTIKSIAYHNTNTTIYVVNPDIPREWFQRLNRALKPLNDHIVDTKIHIDAVKDQHVSMIQVNVMASARILLPDLLECSKVIYLDSDLIVKRPLTRLYNADLQGHPLGAVKDLASDATFNDGVLLLDLDKLRQKPNIVSDMLEYGKKDDLPDGDQSVMNHFFGQDYQVLPFEFNSQIGLEANWDYYNPSDPQSVGMHRSIQQRLGDFNQTIVLHYMCPDKPWSLTCSCRYRNIWWQYHNLQWSQIVNHHLPELQSVQAPALIYTYTDSLINIQGILKELPDMDINVCVPTPTNFYLQLLSKYPNYHLYPKVLHYFIDSFAKNCHVYLDINGQPKNHDLLKQLVARHCPIFSFRSVATPELENYDNYHVFDDNQVHEFAEAVKSSLKKEQVTND